MDQKFYCLLPRHAWSTGLFDFQNRAPRGTKVFIQMVPKWNEVFFFGRDSLLTIITNSFKNPVIQKLGNIFLLFFIFIFYDEAYFLFKNISKIKITKNLTHKSIYFMQMLTSKECLHFSKVHSEMKAFMNKNKKTAP